MWKKRRINFGSIFSFEALLGEAGYTSARFPKREQEEAVHLAARGIFPPEEKTPSQVRVGARRAGDAVAWGDLDSTRASWHASVHDGADVPPPPPPSSGEALMPHRSLRLFLLIFKAGFAPGEAPCLSQGSSTFSSKSSDFVYLFL